MCRPAGESRTAAFHIPRAASIDVRNVVIPDVRVPDAQTMLSKRVKDPALDAVVMIGNLFKVFGQSFCGLGCLQGYLTSNLLNKVDQDHSVLP